ncbi:MAG: hypothetical protein ACE5D7_09575 [Fidelibacterota bacterium]
MKEIKRLLMGFLLAGTILMINTDMVKAEEPGGIYFGIPWGDAGCFVAGICKIVW